MVVLVTFVADQNDLLTESLASMILLLRPPKVVAGEESSLIADRTAIHLSPFLKLFGFQGACSLQTKRDFTPLYLKATVLLYIFRIVR